MGKTENPENPDVSDTTEGEQEEGTEGEETPVIDEENNSGENQEETPDVEEDLAGDSVEDPTEEEAEEPSYGVNAETPQADELPAPVITVKQGAESVSEGETVPNRAENVTFEIAAAEGVTFYYTIDGADPSKESTPYTTAVKVTAPDKDTEETVTIKAIAYKAADDTVAEQTSAVAAAEVVFAAKTYTISMAEESQAYYIYVNDYYVDSNTSYSVTDIKKDVEISYIYAEGMFEVMYRTGEEGTWTSARKKGALAGGSFGEKYAGCDGYYEAFIIPKEALTGNVQVNVRRLNEIAIDWKNGANWDTVGLSAKATRTQSDSKSDYNLVWGPQYFGEDEGYEENKDKLFVAQDTEVTLKVGSYDDVDGFAFTSIKYKKQDDTGNVSDAAEMEESEENYISGHPITYTHEIALGNVMSNDYIVTIDGAYESAISRLEVWGGEKESKQDTYTVYPWRTCQVAAYDQAGRPVALGDSAKVMVGDEEAQKEATPIYSETGKVQYSVEGNKISIPIGGAALEKTITVEAGGKTVTLNVGPTATGVALKDAKLNNTIKQGFGTYVSYPIKVTDGTSQAKGKKSKDDCRVVFENAKVTFTDDTTVTQSVDVGEYVRAYAALSGNSLNVVTEPLSKRNDNKTVKSVEADLVIINQSRNKARTGEETSTDIKTEEKLQTLSLQIVNDGITTKYAEKLTVKATKAASCLYTGQTAIVANVNFPAGTYNRGHDVEVYDIPDGLTLMTSSGRSLSPDAEGVVALSEKDNTLGDGGAILLHAGSNAALGKNIIKVRTTYLSNEDNNVVQATGSVNVTVARGIENIDLSYAPQIYKADAKATTKITVNYNTTDNYADAKSAAPKTKKVTYEIGRMDEWGDFIQNDYPLGSYYKNNKRVPYVTVKNGTVTVDGAYQVEGHDDSDKFAVRVKAADYLGNNESAVAEFKVVSNAVDMGRVVLVDSEGREVKAENGSFTVNKLQTLQAIVVKKDKNANKNGVYKDEDIVSPELYTMIPVKGNVVVERSYNDYEGEYVNRIMVNKLANNVEIVATANDGSRNNKASSGKFNVVYNDTTTLDGSGDKAVQVVYNTAYNDGKEDEGKLSENGNVTFTYPTGTIIHLSVADSNGDPLEGSIYNLKLAVKSGAKVVKKSADNLALDIIMNKKEATVTLSGVTAVKGSDNKPITKTYKITNESLDTAKGSEGAKLKAATPNVTLAKGTKLYAGVKNQKLTFSMNKVAAADKENGEKEYARYVVISAQNSEADTKTLLGLLNEEKIKINPAVKEFTLTCDPNMEMPVLKKGASIAFTFLDRNENIITQTTKAITIKTTALKKSYKLDAKYTLSELDAAKVPLTGKGSAVANVQFTKLYNANIKGQPNRFKEGFELDAEHGTIGLVKDANGGVVADKWYSDRAKGKFNAPYSKNDFIGFVEYTVTYEDGTEVEFVTKITTALSKGSDITAKKYTASAVNVLLKNAEGFPMQGDTGIMVGKLPADIVAAYAVQESGKGRDKKDVAATDFKVLKTADTNGALNVAKINGNMITLEVKTPKKTVRGEEVAAAGTYKGALYVIPKDSIYGDQKKWSDDEIQSKGVRVPITINVKAVNSKSKIKVTAKSVSFLDTEPEKLALEGKFKKYYYAEIPYTANISAGITSVDFENINVKKNESEDKTNGLEFGRAVSKAGFKAVKVNGKNALGLYIDADAFRKELVANDDVKWSGSVFSKVKVTVHFEGEKSTSNTAGKVTYTEAVPESFNISITMPNPMDVTEGGLLLDKVLEIVRNTIRDPKKNAEVKGIADIVYDADRNVLTVIANKPDQNIEDAMTEGTDDAVADALLADQELKSYVDQLQSIGVELNDEQVGTAVKNQNNEGANKQMLKDLLEKYRGKLLEKLEEKDEPPVWESLDKEERKLTIKATSKKGITKTEECTLKFTVIKDYVPGEYEGDDLDVAIKRAVARINSAAAIPGVSKISYDVNSHAVTISVSDEKQDIMASKNAGRDSTVQILLGELGEYMENVEAVKFSRETKYEIKSITVKKETHENGATEKYISSLVDKWTAKLVNELGANANYGRLIDKELTVTTNPDTENEKFYKIVYQLEQE